MTAQNKPRGRGPGSADTSFSGRGGKGLEFSQRQAITTSSKTSNQLRGRGRGCVGTSGGNASTNFRTGAGRGGSRGFGRGAASGLTYHAASPIYWEDVPPRLPPQLEPAVLQQLVDDFKSLGVRSPKRPLRPDYGTLGTEIYLRTNYFAMEPPSQPIFSYVVAISPKPDAAKTARIFQLLEQSSSVSHPIAHDRSQRLVSSKMLPQPLIVTVPFYDDHEMSPGPHARIYSVSITLDRVFDPNEMTSYMEGQLQCRGYDPLPFISALNVILQQHANTAGERSGKNRYFFPTTLPKESISPNLDAVRGFYCSVCPGFKQLLVNVNQCMTAFVKPGNLADILLQFQQSSRGAMPTLPERMASGLKVRMKHLGYKRKLLAVGSTSAKQTFFDCPKYGGKISVEDYFAKEYDIKLKHSDDLPVINVGTTAKACWLPAELCEIEEDNVYRGKLTDKETSQMIRVACNPPRVNAENIVDIGFPSLGFMPPQEPLSNMGLSISNEMYVIPGRRLPGPKVEYRSGTMPVYDAKWNMCNNNKFHRGASVTAGSWVLVVDEGLNKTKKLDLKGFVDKFQQMMVANGMKVPHAPLILPPAKLPPATNDPERKKSLKIIRDLFETQLKAQGGKKPSFVLVLLERRDMYPWIKRLGDIEMGIHTVHIQQLEKAIDEKTQAQYFSNVSLKVNTKLGGVNHLLVSDAMTWLRKVPTMMVGIDVTHPRDNTKGVPSIAAVVASVDEQFAQFPASLRMQKANRVKEMLDELKEMMIERLEAYQQKNKGKLPERIFVYRDGVSESQYDTVLDEELPQILDAFKHFGNVKKPYRPKLSIIICCKRHHTRLLSTKSEFADKNGNTLPGTVVNKGITGTFNFDFFLQAHATIMGQAKPTYYLVVYDENNLSANEIEQGTHHASYLYARATKAVSLIPAAYYADLACEKGRCYLNDFLMEDDDDTVASGRGDNGKKDREEERKKVYEAAKRSWGNGLHPDIRESMFYI